MCLYVCPDVMLTFFNSLEATVFLEKVGKARATAHPEAKTSRFSQTIT